MRFIERGIGSKAHMQFVAVIGRGLPQGTLSVEVRDGPFYEGRLFCESGSAVPIIE